MEPVLRTAGDHWLAIGFDRAGDLAGEKRGYLLAKRSFDLFIATLAITGILTWLLPLLAILIKIDSSGPVFFVQKRVGRNGRLFRCFKLRSMLTNDAADESPAGGNDRRITRIGSWLRSTHLDELPQFWNVIGGSMSIIGPRPYMPSDCRRLAELVPDADLPLRYSVRPGITGMAQSMGLHGATPSDRHAIVERWRWDLYYIRHAGFRLDMAILGDTLALLMSGERTRLLRRAR
ncbi:MAG TPA: sugar transferase [Puia sp.]|nr:sugar transferase [Puia sp.]